MAIRMMKPGEKFKIIMDHEAFGGRYSIGDTGTVMRVTSLKEYELKMDKDGVEVYIHQFVANRYVASVFD